MNNLVPILRADRLREIVEYKKRGYIFRLGEDQYKYVRNIFVNNEKERFCFEVRVSQDEPRFYIVNGKENLKESCIYLTIYELYMLLLEMTKSEKVSTVNKILNSKRDLKYIIEYDSLKFDLNFFSANIPTGKLKIPDSNIEITYENFFLVLALIQDKSNYYWGISTSKNKTNYTDGILRLLITLINSKENSILESHKWKYNPEISKYDKPKEKYELKYYLTKQEFKNIMEVKS